MEVRRPSSGRDIKEENGAAMEWNGMEWKGELIPRSATSSAPMLLSCRQKRGELLEHLPLSLSLSLYDGHYGRLIKVP